MAAALPFIGVAVSAVSAFGQIQAGRAQANGLAQQAAMAQVQARGEALKYREQGVDVLRNIVRTRATIRARAAAGGIDPFSGSADALSTFAMTEGARELYVTRENEIIAREGGSIQSSLLMQQSKSAYNGGIFGAIGTLGSAALSFSKIGGPPAGGAPAGGTK